jgi:acyl-CoA-binding protein
MDLTDLTMILSTIQTDPSEDEFQQAYRDASSLMVKVDDEQKLILYGLYKQSTEGEAPPSPTSDSLVEKHKW